MPYSTGEATREQILRSCRKLFYEKGYDNTSLDDICADAHVSRGTVHYHFGSVAAIRSVIGREYWNRMSCFAHVYCGNRYFFITITVMQWYAFFKDPKFRDFMSGYTRSSEPADDIFAAYMVRLVCECFGHPSTQLNEFLVDRPALLFTISRAESAVCEFYATHLDQYSYLDAAYDEFSTVSKLLDMRIKEIYNVWVCAIPVLEKIPLEKIDTTLG